MDNPDRRWMETALALAQEGMASGGGPFGAVVVRDGKQVASGVNGVTSASDPTAHAEIVAIRAACQRLKTFVLAGCVLYTSCEPCPMCLGAVYWARLDAVFYAATREDAARAGFDDAHFYDEIARPIADRHLPMRQMLRAAGQEVFAAWAVQPDKTPY